MNLKRHTLTATALFFLAAFIAAGCGAGKKDEKALLNDKKVELEKLKKEQSKLNEQITTLEKEIARLDPAADAAKAKLVAVEPLGVDSFRHYIDLQGRIDATNVANVAPRNGGGVVKALYVRQGQNVGKGQLLLKLEDALQRQSVTAAQQQISGIKAQLAQAQTIYEKYQNLWKNNIGTEVQVLNAKTNVETLQSQLQATEANVRLAQEQLSFTNVYAEMGGTVDVLDVRLGEMFTGARQITIVNTGKLKIKAEVPENYIGKVNVGSRLKVLLPELNKTIEAKVDVVGKLINPSTRTFTIEAPIATNKDFKPNQIAKVQILDYAKNDAFTIPVNTLQTDDKGKFVMVAVEENGKLRARKKYLTVGELYEDRLEATSGLALGDKIITEGFQSIYEGQLITTSAQ